MTFEMAINWNRLLPLTLRHKIHLSRGNVKPCHGKGKLDPKGGIFFFQQNCTISSLSGRLDLTQEVARFCPELSVEEAVTPPSSWYEIIMNFIRA